MASWTLKQDTGAVRATPRRAAGSQSRTIAPRCSRPVLPSPRTGSGTVDADRTAPRVRPQREDSPKLTRSLFGACGGPPSAAALDGRGRDATPRRARCQTSFRLALARAALRTRTVFISNALSHHTQPELCTHSCISGTPRDMYKVSSSGRGQGANSFFRPRHAFLIRYSLIYV
jgi:hypothetical protein